MSQPRRRGRYEHTALLRVAVVIVVAESGYPVIVAASGAVSSDSRCQRLQPLPPSPCEIGLFAAYRGGPQNNVPGSNDRC